MITGWEVYWITRLDGIVMILGVSAFILGALLAIQWLYPTVEDEREELFGVMAKKIYKIFIPAFLIVTLLAVLIPSTKEVAAIYIVPKIVNNEQVQKLPDNALKFMNKKFEEWVEDLSEKKKKR